MRHCSQGNVLLSTTKAHGAGQNARESSRPARCPHKAANGRPLQRWRASSRRNGEGLSDRSRSCHADERTSDVQLGRYRSRHLQYLRFDRLPEMVPMLQIFANNVHRKDAVCLQTALPGTERYERGTPTQTGECSVRRQTGDP